MREGASPGFGLYVHWPFCLSKCPYCDFNSHVRAKIDADAWGDALCRELKATAARIDRRDALDSIFFGGGTPSLMPGAVVARVLDTAEEVFGFSPEIEITLEANPTSVEAGRFRDYRSAGVNRVSLGVQALNDADLKYLGRMHTAAEALNAVALAQSVFPRVSFDLIYARPSQNSDAWARELDEALAQGCTHYSLYQLTFEEGTPFFDAMKRGLIKPLDEERSAALFEETQARMNAVGLPAYEVSNHAKPGAESRHNLIYWRYGDYVGVGPGAHGRVTSNGKRYATSTVRNPEAWIKGVGKQGSAIEHWDEVSEAEAGAECLLMGLRLNEGVSRPRIERLLGRRLKTDDCAARGLIVADETRVTATPQGRLVLNAVIRELLG